MPLLFVIAALGLYIVWGIALTLTVSSSFGGIPKIAHCSA